MYRRLSALVAAAALCATAACGTAGDLTGPDDAPLPMVGGAVYDETDDNGGMFGNGNIAGDTSGEATATVDDGGTLGTGDVVEGAGATADAPTLYNGGMFGNGN